MANKLIEKIYEILEKADLKEICDVAFEVNAHCVCVYKGSDDYFDTHMMQWYPGDDPEFEVDGYEDYKQQIIESLVDLICSEIELDKSEIQSFVEENLDDLCDYVLDEYDFEDKAIDEYEEY